MKTRIGPPPEWRIAVVWPENWMQAQVTLQALWHRAGSSPTILCRRFEATDIDDFQRDVVQPLCAWNPHGLIVRIMNAVHLKTLRRNLLDIPFVSTLVSPPDLANTSVVVDIAEAIALARDHFHSRGLRHMALYCCAEEHAVASRTHPFQTLVPEGHVFVLKSETKSAGLGSLDRWLQALPKPVGVMALESRAAGFLLQRCHELGLRVPREVQVIGIDDTDECVACKPHLTSIDLPSARIGEMAMETMLRYLKKEKPSPPPLLPVTGCTLSIRESTALESVGTLSGPATLGHLQTHSRQGLPVARLAELSGVSRATLYRQFAATRDTPAHRMRQLRLQEACRMLRESSAPLTAIAKACGYSNTFSFSRFFKRETGEMPAAYRTKSRGKC